MLSFRVTLGLALSLAAPWIHTGCESTVPAPPQAATTTPAPAPITASGTPSSGNPATDPPTRAEVTYAEIGELRYLERIVGEASADDPLPMVVAIHGLGDRPENFGRVLDTFPEPIRLILPRGLDDHGEGFSWFPIRARDQKVEELAQGIEHAADVLAVGIAGLAKTRPTKGKPIVTGFSQGGMLSFELAVHHPEVVGYAVPVGGWLPPPLWPADRAANGAVYPTIHALHGTADNAVPFEPTAAAVAKLSELGFDATLTSYEGVPHAIAPPVHRDLTDRLIDAVLVANKAGVAKP